MDKSRVTSTGATLIEFALVLPLVIGLMFTGLFFAVYAVTQLTFSLNTTRIAEKAVAVAPQDSPSDYLAAICKFVSDEIDAQTPFYTSYVSGIKTVSIKTSKPNPTSDSSVVTIRRQGQFNFLNSQRWGLPDEITASGSALLSSDTDSGSCDDAGSA